MTGWIAGAGAEYAFSPRWSVKLEYLFADFRNQKLFIYPSNTLPAHAPNFQVGYLWKTQLNIVRVGVNFHFD